MKRQTQERRIRKTHRETNYEKTQMIANCSVHVKKFFFTHTHRHVRDMTRREGRETSKENKRKKNSSG